MTSKRALIVDDSKSARFALKRMLNSLNLQADTVESAADAMTYLEDHLPDVIFMDHMMPGMDGFEAVKRIKNNPQTAIIPIMMYTSKGGDVYLSQARALGAVGIIRKTIAPVELKDSLLELGIIEDIPLESTLKFDKKAEGKKVVKISKEDTAKKENVLDIYVKDLHKLMDDQTIELHRSMWLGIESVSNEIFNRLNNDLEEKLEKIQRAPQETVDNHSDFYKSKAAWPVYLVGLILLLSISINISLVYDVDQLKNSLAMAENNQPALLNESVSESENKQVRSAGRDYQQARIEFTKWALNKVIEYPYDEVALNDNRLSNVEELIDRALKVKYKGRIIFQTHAGKFCLNTDHMGNYKLAEDNVSIADCEFIGNYIQPNDVPTSHQSLSFANYLSDTTRLREKGIDIEVTSVTRELEFTKYPKRTPQTTADKWNQAAKLNNRIVVMLEPASLDVL